MTDFEKYLGDWLLHSGERYCDLCAHRPDDRLLLCDNLKREGELDDEVCLQGIRQYAEQRELLGKHGGEEKG